MQRKIRELARQTHQDVNRNNKSQVVVNNIDQDTSNMSENIYDDDPRTC